MSISDDPHAAGPLIAKLGIRFALAHAELDAHLNDLGSTAKVLTFLPMAAKGAEAAVPEEIIAQEDEDFVVRRRSTQDNIELTIEPLGYLAADEVADKPANIRTRDGYLDYDFTFDQEGYGTIVLKNTNAMEQAITAGLQIQIGR